MNKDQAEYDKWDRLRSWRDWFSVCHDLHAAVVNFYAGDSGENITKPQRIIRDQVPLDEATGIGSKVNTMLKENHQILLDLDCPHVYVPSSSSGHGHLILRTRVTFDEYVGLLEHMARLGIIEKGYVSATKNRGEGWLRVPWLTKNQKTHAVGY